MKAQKIPRFLLLSNVLSLWSTGLTDGCAMAMADGYAPRPSRPTESTPWRNHGSGETLAKRVSQHKGSVQGNMDILCTRPNKQSRLLLKMAIEIVDLPMKNGDFHSYVSLPEGYVIRNYISGWWYTCPSEKIWVKWKYDSYIWKKWKK